MFLLLDGGLSPASLSSQLQGSFSNPGPTAWCVSVGNLRDVVCYVRGASSPFYVSSNSWGCVPVFTIKNSNSNYKAKIITKQTNQEGNILKLLIIRHCFHDVMIYSMTLSAIQHAVN